MQGQKLLESGMKYKNEHTHTFLKPLRVLVEYSFSSLVDSRMLDIINGPFILLFSGSAPSSHTDVNGDPQIDPAIPCDHDMFQKSKRSGWTIAGQRTGSLSAPAVNAQMQTCRVDT